MAQLVNTRSQAYRKLQPDLNSLDARGICSLIGENPRILIRPLIATTTELLLGFKEEQYQSVLAPNI